MTSFLATSLVNYGESQVLTCTECIKMIEAKYAYLRQNMPILIALVDYLKLRPGKNLKV